MQLRSYVATWLALLTAWLSAPALLVQHNHDSASRLLYLVSGTPTVDTDETFSANLYVSADDKKLRLVREIVSQRDGLHSVHGFGGVLFLVHPHILPTTVSIIHFDDPTQSDEVLFNPAALVVIDSKLAMSEPPTGGPRELLFLADPAGDRTKDLLVSVAAARSNVERRVEPNRWSDYSALRFDGREGGPMPSPDLVGAPIGGTLAIKVFSHEVNIEPLPDWVLENAWGRVPVVIAASKEYLVLILQHTPEELASGQVTARTSEMGYEHDRPRGVWKQIRIDGTCSRSRLFGNWLATTVEAWDPGHKPNPGAERERSTSAGGRPDVRAAYAIWNGKNCRIPGVLVLHNLSDGRKISIETGQEDSEVLWTGTDSVLYRVNDTIYQAKIAGDQLRDTLVVVKDDDVPEIHWVFWSK